MPKELHEKADLYCKENFGDNRVAMFKYLWDFYFHNSQMNTLRAETFIILEQFHERLAKLEGKAPEESKKEKVSWKGFSNKIDKEAEQNDGKNK